MFDLFTKVPTLLAALLTMASCTTNYTTNELYFATTEVHTEHTGIADTSLKDKLYTIATATENVETGVNECPPFTPPKAEPIPDLPSLSESDMEDAQIVEAVLIEHISTLRLYVIDQENNLNAAYLKYSKKCPIRVEVQE